MAPTPRHQYPTWYVGTPNLVSDDSADFAYNAANQTFIGFDFYKSKDSGANGINDSCSIVGFFGVSRTYAWILHTTQVFPAMPDASMILG